MVWPLLLLVAFLLGRRFVEAPPPAAECPPPPVCAPLSQVAKPEPRRNRAKRVTARRLPEEVPTEDPHREALLAWVRARSPAWSGCVSRGTQPIDAAVTMEVAEDGEIRRVGISADKALEAEQVACLERQITALSLPVELCRGRQRLLFGLRI